MVVVIAAVLLVTLVIIPGNNYRNAVALKEEGKYEEAITAFQALNEEGREEAIGEGYSRIQLSYDLKGDFHHALYLNKTNEVRKGELEDIGGESWLTEDYRLKLPLDAEHLFSVVLYTDWYGENLTYHRAVTAELTPEQGEAFIRDCVLPDLAEHKLGRQWLVFNEEYFSTVMNLSIQVQLRQSSDLPDEPYRYEWFNVQLTADAERCLQWIRENTTLTPLTLAEAGAENTPE